MIECPFCNLYLVPSSTLRSTDCYNCGIKTYFKNGKIENSFYLFNKSAINKLVASFEDNIIKYINEHNIKIIKKCPDKQDLIQQFQKLVNLYKAFK